MRAQVMLRLAYKWMDKGSLQKAHKHSSFKNTKMKKLHKEGLDKLEIL